MWHVLVVQSVSRHRRRRIALFLTQLLKQNGNIDFQFELVTVTTLNRSKSNVEKLCLNSLTV